MATLTESLVKAKTRMDRVSDVRNLNLWGQDLVDVSILAEMPNVEVLSLSVNRIASLKSFQYCTKLQELYLRKNEVGSLQELHYLAGLPGLRVLWLSDNPCAQVPNYRQTVLSLLPNLTKLDNSDIAPEERAALGASPAAAAAYPRPSSAAGAPPQQHAPPPQQHMPPPQYDGRPPSGRPGSGRGDHADITLAPSGSPQYSAAQQYGAPPAAPSAYGRPSSGRASPPGNQVASRQGSQGNSSTNVLYAVMALLGELDVDGLRVAKKEVDARLYEATAPR